MHTKWELSNCVCFSIFNFVSKLQSCKGEYWKGNKIVYFQEKYSCNNPISHYLSTKGEITVICKVYFRTGGYFVSELQK